MTATNHALTGAVVALAIKKPELAIPLAFLSHFAVDAIPHFEARVLSEKFSRLFIFSDVITSVILAVIVALTFNVKAPSWLLLSCSAAAVSPDFMWAYRYWRLKDMDKVFEEPMSRIARFHLDIQLSETLQGILVEIVWLIIMVIFLFELN